MTFFFKETLSDRECRARNLDIEYGYGIALIKQCMTSDSARRYAAGCNVTYYCLQGYQISGLKEFICTNGMWVNTNGDPDENLPECKKKFVSLSKKSFKIDSLLDNIDIYLCFNHKIYLMYQKF